jgi:hypothetical protein
MATVREQLLLDEYKVFRKTKFISIDQVENLMYQIEKVFMNIRDITESRDQWKNKYEKLKTEVKK